MLLMRRALRNSLQLVAVVVLSLLSACADKPKGNVIPPDKLEDVLYDYHLAQVMISDLPSSQRYKKDLYFDYVYDKHGVTKAEIDSSLVYYARYPEGLSEVYTNLSKRIEADIQRMENEGQLIKARKAVAVAGDSVDIWYNARVVQMTSSPLANSRYAFTIPADTNFKAGDHLTWCGKVLFLDDDIDSLHRYLHLNLKVEYVNDSIVSTDTLLYTSGDFVITAADTALVKNIEGEAYLKSDRVGEHLLLVAPSLMRCRQVEHSDSLHVDSMEAGQSRKK